MCCKGVVRLLENCVKRIHERDKSIEYLYQFAFNPKLHSVLNTRPRILMIFKLQVFVNPSLFSFNTCNIF